VAREREDAFAFARGERFACLVNFGPDLGPPHGAEVLIASGKLEGGAVPVDTTVWFLQNDKTQEVTGKEER
jgi:hypothetical protein